MKLKIIYQLHLMIYKITVTPFSSSSDGSAAGRSADFLETSDFCVEINRNTLLCLVSQTKCKQVTSIPLKIVSVSYVH